MIKRLITVFSTIVFLFSVSVFAQTPKPTPKSSKPGKTSLTNNKSTTGQKKTTAAKTAPKNDKEELDKIIARTEGKTVTQDDLVEKIKALQKFVVDFPKSEERVRALEILVSTRARLADEKLRFSETDAGIQLFKDAVNEAPTPISEKLFAEVILQFPTNLFSRGQQAAAVEIAKLIEEKVGTNYSQLLNLATFYLGTENAEEARRIAEKIIASNETAAPNAQQKTSAYQALGLAYRLNFQLEESEKAYAQALELNPDSIVSKRSLAEMKRALGKSDEALALYRELVEKNPTDMSANSGLILSLFNSGKQAEAEDALNKSLEANPNNLFLLVGAAYWYAGQKNGDKAVEYARKAIEIEPRYTWAYIALARGLSFQKQPLEAEKILLRARQYGKFPTLQYELATVRLSAGFFEEAAYEIWKTLIVKDDGTVSTNLAGRIPKEGKDFIELLNLERRASIYEATTADTPENAERIKNLLYFYQLLGSKDATEEQINRAVDEFVKGDDNMRTHRQLYAANQLLIEKKSLPKVLELTQGAVKGVDASLNVLNPSASVMADELLESRFLANQKGEVIVVPDVPRQTLSTILREKIEEISGWALYQQGKTPEAIVRLRRAASIAPEKSAWWRSSLWRLGVAYDTNGNAKEALDAYVKSYTNSQPDGIKWGTIEAVYRKVNGNTDGLDQLIGTKPIVPETVAQVTTPTPTPEVTPTPSPEASPTPTENPTPEATPTPAPEIKTESSPTPTPEVKADPTPTPEEKKTETPPTVSASPEVKTDDKTVKTDDKPADTKPANKPLFEPVVITVPKTEAIKPANDKPAEKNGDKSTESANKPSDDTVSIFNRPRVVVEDKLAKTSSEEPPSCLVVSQDRLSILSQGGNLGILVGYSGEGDISKITGESANPNDINVTPDPEVIKQTNRMFFLIKSTSANKGVFTVTFNSPCGKKEVLVKVR